MRGKIKRALAGLFVLLLALCLSAGLYVGLKGYGMYREALEQKPLAEMAEQVRAQPDFTPLDELPRLYRDAVVAVEDHRFYSHGGVDFIALCRAHRRRCSRARRPRRSWHGPSRSSIPRTRSWSCM